MFISFISVCNSQPLEDAQGFTTLDSEEKSDQKKIKQEIWQIGKKDSGDIEFNAERCEDVKNRESNEWIEAVNFKIGDDIKCFPGKLWSKDEETKQR